MRGSSMTPQLLAHIEDQQTRAMHLEGLMQALLHLQNEDVEPGAQITLATLARDLAAELNRALDRMNLPGDRT